MAGVEGRHDVPDFGQRKKNQQANQANYNQGVHKFGLEMRLAAEHCLHHCVRSWWDQAVCASRKEAVSIAAGRGLRDSSTLFRADLMAEFTGAELRNL